VKTLSEWVARIVLPSRALFPLRPVMIVMIFAALAVAFITGPGDRGACGSAQPGQVEGKPEALLPPQITILADGEAQTLAISRGTVAEALSQAGIVLGPLDRVEPSLDQPVGPGTEIRVTRVEMKVLYEEISEPYQTIILANPDLRPGLVEKVLEGRSGKICRETRIWKKDGAETLREVTSTSRLREKIDAVEMWGAASLPSRGGIIRRHLSMAATAYDPGPISCGKYADGYTSIGLKAGRGVVAVDPRVIPLGTRLYIEGYGLAVAGDVGSAIKGRRIDLGFPTYREALQYGRRTVKVYLLE